MKREFEASILRTKKSPDAYHEDMRYENITQARFMRRPNRFIAEVEVDGVREIVHVKNTGRCKELLLPGCDVWLTSPDSPGRKTKYDLVSVRKSNGLIINIDSQAPNKVVKEWLGSQGFNRIVPEYTYGDSRIDFYMEKKGPDGSSEKYLMEVKGCTLEVDGIGYFPDAPTERGVKHIHELIKAKKEGCHAILAFVIQMDGIKEVRPNKETHPQFVSVFDEAIKAGVKILFLTCHVEPDSLEIMGCEEKRAEKHYTYILRCSDGSLYTGYTNDLEKRVHNHNAGKGARYTKTRLPVELVYFEQFDTKMEALSREWHIKHDLTREEKLRLIEKRSCNCMHAHTLTESSHNPRMKISLTNDHNANERRERIMADEKKVEVPVKVEEKKVEAPKAVAEKAPVKKVAAKKSAVKKATAKKTPAAKKAAKPAEKAVAEKKAPVKKTAAKKASAAKAPAKKVAEKKAVAKKTPAKRGPAKRVAKKFGKIIFEVDGQQIALKDIEKKAKKLGGDVYVVAAEKKIYDTAGNAVELF